MLMAWALSLAAGPDGLRRRSRTLAGSIAGKLVLFGLTLCVFYHLANGVRHLAWDAGYGFKPKTADATGLAGVRLRARRHHRWSGALIAHHGRRSDERIRTPLGRARGMGSAKHGVGHFIAQRVTAIALVLLVLWGAGRGAVSLAARRLRRARPTGCTRR